MHGDDAMLYCKNGFTNTQKRHALDIEQRQSAETLASHAERSGSGVGGGVRQPAQVLAHLHPDIAVFAPRRPPRVADDPVPDYHVKITRTIG